MDLINEFAYILSKNKPTDFNTVLPVNSKIRRLYDLVVSNKAKNDTEASKLIYDSTKADKKYLMLKRNLVQKLSDLVYLQNYQETENENYMTIHFQVEKELLIVEKLLLKNVYHNPTKIITKVEQTAEKFFFIDIQVAAARKFRSVYSLKGFPKETVAYDEKVKQLTKYQNYYSASRGMWEKLYSKTKYSIAKTNEIVREALEYSQNISKWLKDYDSPFIRLYYHQINILLYHQLNQQPKVLEHITKTEKLITDFPFIDTKALQLDINYYFARYFRDTHQIELAEQNLTKCLEKSDYRAFDKFLIQELNFDIKIKQKQYTEAANILNEVVNTPQFQFLDANDKSAWVIREAFIFFLLHMENNQELINKLSIFGDEKSLHYFLEKANKSTKDKFGYNINLLIIRVLLFKIYKQTDIDNEGNNLSIYYHRYLKKLNSKRTVAFFRHLGKSASQDFDYNELIIRKEKFLNRLKEINDPNYDVFEIIPYEKFWELLIQLSEKKH
ncbi:MAG: hypothetical protein JEZ09_14060 [Salinivirgaceae bacterium]|nr:hypothetical protein [Salinivirgaceae bacterium]